MAAAHPPARPADQPPTHLRVAGEAEGGFQLRSRPCQVLAALSAAAWGPIPCFFSGGAVTAPSNDRGNAGLAAEL